MSPIQISVVVPVYNEEHNIRPFLERMEKVLNDLKQTYEIIFTLDPCEDATEAVITHEINRNPNIKLIVFSRRFSQAAATMAGILKCKGNTCVVIDVDLQDPPELIKELYAKVSQGYDVVYAKRKSRKGETILKKVVSYWAYYLINKISDVRIPRNTGDFRIMTRRVIEQLRILNETHGFLRGLVSFVGFKQTFVEYDRDQRLSGQGKYNRFIGSLKVGINGLISFSSVPLTFILGMGFCLFSISLILIILRVMLGNNFFAVFSMTDFVILLLSSVQLISLGILGEYIGRIYDEVKRRPMYIIDRQVNFDQQA